MNSSDDRLLRENYILSQQLAMKDRHLRLILESISIILFGINPDGILILEIGKGLEELNTVPGEWAGKSIHDYFNADHDAIQLFNKAMKGEEIDTELEVAPGHYYRIICRPTYSDKETIDHIYGVAERILKP